MISRFTVFVVAAAVFACDEPPAQDPSQQQLSYQNGYPQTTTGTQSQSQSQPAVTYTPTEPAATAAAPATTQAAQPAATATAPVQIQTTPVPVGVQALPPPSATATAGGKPPAPAATTKTMAIPGPGAFSCQSDSQCLLGRCNTLYGRCAYPCKNSDIDCKPNNVCTAAGLCMPRAGGGLGM